MRDYQPPTPLVNAVAIGALMRGGDDLHEYRYNPGQPRDHAGRWTRGSSSAAAHHAHEAATQHRTDHPGSTTPEPPHDNHAPDPHHSARSSLKAHLHLVAAHTAFALGKKGAAAHHLSRAEHHFGQAGEEHQAGERVARDMGKLKDALKPKGKKTRRYGLELPDLHEYRYNPGQPRDHAGRWTDSKVGADAHAAANSYHTNKATLLEAAGDKAGANRHRATRLAHEAAQHIKLGQGVKAQGKLAELKQHLKSVDDEAKGHYETLHAKLSGAVKGEAVPVVSHYRPVKTEGKTEDAAPAPAPTLTHAQHAESAAKEAVSLHRIANAHGKLAEAEKHVQSGNHAEARKAIEAAQKELPSGEDMKGHSAHAVMLHRAALDGATKMLEGLTKPEVKAEAPAPAEKKVEPEKPAEEKPDGPTPQQKAVLQAMREYNLHKPSYPPKATDLTDHPAVKTLKMSAADVDAAIQSGKPHGLFMTKKAQFGDAHVIAHKGNDYLNSAKIPDSGHYAPKPPPPPAPKPEGTLSLPSTTATITKDAAGNIKIAHTVKEGSYVARITGSDTQYGLGRIFLSKEDKEKNPKEKWRDYEWKMADGVYEHKLHDHKTQHGFFTVEDGKVTPIEKEDVLKHVDRLAPKVNERILKHARIRMKKHAEALEEARFLDKKPDPQHLEVAKNILKNLSYKHLTDEQKAEVAGMLKEK